MPTSSRGREPERKTERRRRTREKPRQDDSSAPEKSRAPLREEDLSRLLSLDSSQKAEAIRELQGRYGNQRVQAMLGTLAQPGASLSPGSVAPSEGERFDEESGQVSADVSDRIESQRGVGAPLDTQTRAEMEASFGQDFSEVRAHTGQEADSLNQDVQAKAFTVGKDIFFSSGSYAPGSTTGKELLAHELTHVVQQKDAPKAGTAPTRVTSPDEASEVEAAEVGQAMVHQGELGRQAAEEEEELQAARQEVEEEEELQAARQEVEEEEELQPARQEVEEEEELQAARQEVEEEEELQPARQEVEEEEELQAARQEEEEELQLARQEEEEELQPARHANLSPAVLARAPDVPGCELGGGRSQDHYSSKELAVADVPAHVVPKDCFVWGAGHDHWRVIPGTGCAHWVAHEENITAGATCDSGLSLRVTDVIAGRAQHPLAEAEVGDIWKSTVLASHVGIVRAVETGPESNAVTRAQVENDSSGQGGVVTNWFTSGEFYR